MISELSGTPSVQNFYCVILAWPGGGGTVFCCWLEGIGMLVWVVGLSFFVLAVGVLTRMT